MLYVCTHIHGSACKISVHICFCICTHEDMYTVLTLSCLILLSVVPPDSVSGGLVSNDSSHAIKRDEENHCKGMYVHFFTIVLNA